MVEDQVKVLMMNIMMTLFDKDMCIIENDQYINKIMKIRSIHKK